MELYMKVISFFPYIETPHCFKNSKVPFVEDKCQRWVTYWDQTWVVYWDQRCDFDRH